MGKVDTELKSLQFMAKTLAQSAEFFIDKYYEWEDDTPECYVYGTEEDIRRYRSFVAALGRDLDALTEALLSLSLGLAGIETFLKREEASRKRKNTIYLKKKGAHGSVFKAPQKARTQHAASKIRNHHR